MKIKPISETADFAYNFVYNNKKQTNSFRYLKFHDLTADR